MIIPSDLKKWLKMRMDKCIHSNTILLYIEALEEDVGSKIAEIARLENRIQQLESAQPKWISVEERLPGDPLDGVGDVVELLIDKGDVKEVLPGYYDHDEKDWVIYLGDILGDYRRKTFSWWRVIKWRPFPEPPKEEA